MKKFRFPLRPVAILREHHQTLTREAFAAAVHLFVQAEERLAAKRTQRQSLETIMHDGRRATFRAADEIAFWSAYRRVCDEEIVTEREVFEARSVMDNRREKYLEAHRAVKVIEKLEQKARNNHRLEVEREAQIDSDELAGLRVSRRLASSTVVSS